MSPFQWSSMQRIVAFRSDITVSTLPVPTRLLSRKGVLRPVDGAKLPSKVAGKLI
jgi:hypothetical protein